MMRLAVVSAVLMVLGYPLLVHGEPQRMADGKRIYETACARCHDTGALGAPVLGRTGDWQDRSSLWEAVLFEHANSGYLAMPAQSGEGGLSEYDVDAASEYLLTRSHPELLSD